jgi:hypothetical protein
MSTVFPRPVRLARVERPWLARLRGIRAALRQRGTGFRQPRPTQEVRR